MSYVMQLFYSHANSLKYCINGAEWVRFWQCQLAPPSTTPATTWSSRDVSKRGEQDVNYSQASLQPVFACRWLFVCLVLIYDHYNSPRYVQVLNNSKKIHSGDLYMLHLWKKLHFTFLVRLVLRLLFIFPCSSRRYWPFACVGSFNKRADSYSTRGPVVFWLTEISSVFQKLDK